MKIPLTLTFRLSQICNVGKVKKVKYLASYQGRRTHAIRDDIVEIFSKRKIFMFVI